MSRTSVPCPGPWQDAVANMVKDGQPPADVAAALGVTLYEVGNALVMVKQANDHALWQGAHWPTGGKDG